MTPEEAVMLGYEPIVGPSKRETAQTARLRLRMTRLAKEYVIDFNLPKACARAGLEWDDVKHAERDAYFICYVQELIEQIDPDIVMTRQEILMALKREAFGAGKSADRIRALNVLAELTGMGLPDPSKDKSNQPPTINLTITHASPNSGQGS